MKIVIYGRRLLRALFLPAIYLLNRISFTGKFTLLWLLSLFAVAMAGQELYATLDRVIQPSQRQHEGLELLKPVAQTIQAVQLHREISAALLGGNVALRGQRATRESETNSAFEALEAKLPAKLATDENFRHIKADWQRLRNDGLDWNAEANFNAHTRLIKLLHGFQTSVADEYWLTLDSEIATYYLIDTAIDNLPHVLEQLGQLRAYGAGILAKKNISERQKIKLHNLIAELDTSLMELKDNADKSGRNNPELQRAVAQIAGGADNTAQHITAFVTSNIIAGKLTATPEYFLNMTTPEIGKSYAQLYDLLLPGIDATIKARMTRAKSTLYSSLALSFFAFLVVLYFSVSMYYAIIGSIKSLTRSAHSFAGGNLHERAKLATHDELSKVGNSFNEMADGFNAMLEARKHADELLKKESHKNETLLRAASDGVHVLDLMGNVVQVNDAFCRMLGYTAAELVSMNVTQWDAQMTAVQIHEKLAAFKDAADRFETRHRRRDGSIIDVEVNAVKVEIDGQQLVYCSSREVTERKQAERALLESQGKFRAVVETALDAVVQIDSTGIITGWSSQAEKIFGWTGAEALGRMLHETIIPPQYREAHVQGLKHFLLTGEGPILNTRLEITALHRDGREFPVELSVASIKVAGKHEFSAFIRDITRKKESEDLIWRQANFDMLTGLPNRHMFNDRLAQEIKKAHRAGLKMALLFIDLDKFKEINDALGHGMGDILLMEAARRIGECVRETDIVARLGGDEFTVVLPELADASSSERVAENIRRKLAEPFQLGNDVVYISASIGITLYPVDALEAEELLKNADQAMYLAKSKGRNRFCYFTQSMQHAAQTRMKLIGELRGALAGHQFVAYYQPVVDMTTGRIDKAEALIRWRHPRLGLVNPAQFIHLAEETGLIVEIGDWIFREAARQLKHWKETLHTEMQISVNVSPVQFSDTGSHYKEWFAYLEELGLSGRNMVIEITEGLLLKTESGANEKLIEFRDAGIQVAIDDFGTGYSALSYLKKLDIDYLKIDQSFVRDLEVDPDDMALCEAIIVMAHKLGLKVVAEGVETEAQRKLLRDAGCDIAQGYLFSKPLSVEKFEELVKACK